MECLTNPPYLCGSDGKSYCTVCQACSNPEVEWYISQDLPCAQEAGEKTCGGIAGKICPSGYKCLYEGNYPDASGICIKDKTQNCVIYPKPEDVEKYHLQVAPQNYCASCGDGVCDYIEKCLPSHPITADCGGGGLYCPQDCES